MKYLVFGFLQITLLIGLLSITDQTRSAPTLTAGDEIVLFDNGNIYAVANGPTVPTKFTIRQTHVVTLIMDYHWNNGRGTRVGTIGLRVIERYRRPQLWAMARQRIAGTRRRAEC
jgi:hypothetical protein